MKTSFFLLTAVLCALGLHARGADTYQIDPVHSSVVFSIKHAGVTDFHGTFNEINGTVVFDAADPSKSSVQLSVPVQSLDSRHPKRDAHLKSPDFFNAEKFPAVTFKSTQVEGSGDVFQVTGDFTLLGVTKSITVEFKRGKEGKGMEGEIRGGGETRFTLKRSDYGMTFMPDMLGDEVSLVVSVEGIKQ
jgi:polyisoprenoid-binding protein YceI